MIALPRPSQYPQTTASSTGPSTTWCRRAPGRTAPIRSQLKSKQTVFCSGRCILLLQTQSEMGYRALHQCIWRHILGSGRVRPKSFENIHSQLGAWNPLDDWIWLDKPFLVEVLERIGPIYIDDFQNIYDVNETATFKFRFSCMGSKTCISIDWDDGSRCFSSNNFR